MPLVYYNDRRRNLINFGFGLNPELIMTFLIAKFEA